MEKSEKLQVKTVYLNPTEYYMKVRAYLRSDPDKWYKMNELPPASPDKPNKGSNDTFVGPFCANTGNSAEVVQSMLFISDPVHISFIDNGEPENDIGFTIFLWNDDDVEKKALDNGKTHSDPDFESYLDFEEDKVVMKCSTGLFTKSEGLSGGSIWTIMATANKGNDIQQICKKLMLYFTFVRVAILRDF